MKTRFFFLVLLTSIGWSSVNAQIPTDGLVGYWPFNGNANDESGNGLNGVIKGATLTTDRFGNTDRAYSFDGINDEIDVSDSPLFEENARTVTCWIYADAYCPTWTIRSDIIGKGYLVAGQWVIQLEQSGKIRNMVSTTTGEHTFNSSNSINLYNWYFIACTWDGATSKTYINGEYVGNILTSGTQTQGNDSLRIGRTHLPLLQYFNGKIDDICLYNRALTQTEITNMFLSSTIPSWLPIDGLVAWYPFNGNANDESGNGLNGTVNGATLTTDRFGNNDRAYSFDGTNDEIDVSDSPLFEQNARTVALWVNAIAYNPSWTIRSDILGKDGNPRQWVMQLEQTGKIRNAEFANQEYTFNSNSSISLGEWYFIACTWDGSTSKTYINGLYAGSISTSGNQVQGNEPLRIGRAHPQFLQYFKGKIDDICIYNRALTQEEISLMYNGCDLSVQVTPLIYNVTTNSNAQFVVSSADSNTTYQWQSNPADYGWINIPENTTYTGSTNDTLIINNIQFSNHLQPFRVVATDGSCIDTSNVATIYVTDTCLTYATVYDTTFITMYDTTIVTVYDTTFTTIIVYDSIAVTDTLIIDVTLVGINPPNNVNTIKVYPNPTKDIVYISTGDHYALMSNYRIRIINSSGQQIFESLISQQLFEVNISAFGALGLYYIELYDDSNQLIDVRKILLE